MHLACSLSVVSNTLFSYLKKCDDGTVLQKLEKLGFLANEITMTYTIQPLTTITTINNRVTKCYHTLE